jgi:hypothetical protein
MRRVLAIVLLFMITVPPLIYFYLRSHDKDLAGVLLVVFGGFFVDRCMDAWDRHDLSVDVRKLGDTIEGTVRRVMVEAGVATLWRVPMSMAFVYAEDRLKGASKMLNTAFSRRGHGTAVSKSWISAIADAVAKNGCVVEEVAAFPDRERAVRSILSHQESVKGSYLVTDISKLVETNPNLPFTEFVVFEHSTGKEVVFGWSSSRDVAISQDCFMTTYPPVVALFEAQFDRLAQLGPRKGIEAEQIVGRGRRGRDFQRDSPADA